MTINLTVCKLPRTDTGVSLLFLKTEELLVYFRNSHGEGGRVYAPS